jgi:hypothetical protein
MRGRTVVAGDRLQPGYRYRLTARTGADFDPGFEPELTPREMLRLGVFAGCYFDRAIGEFPRDWFADAKVARHPDPSLNYFSVAASQSREAWQRKGWIWPDDPRGWFQWYCRYYLGRRVPGEDQRQIQRWRAMRRHIRQIRGSCEPGDLGCRRRQRQALLHWAYDSRAI